MSSVIRTHTLQAAYECRKGLKKIYAQGVPCTYIVAREKLFWDHCMGPLDPKERCFFEVIELDKPCHLYIDLDVDLVKYPMIDVHDVKDMVCGHIESVLYDKFDKEDVSKIVAESSNDKKGSLHILYKIKGMVFANNAHVGAFMRRIKKFKVDPIPQDKDIWQLFVDMCVYSRNRLFRMLGSTKLGENRLKKVTDMHFNFNNWQLCQVQPLCLRNAECITVDEPDGSPAKYKGVAKVFMPNSYQPHMKKLLVEFGNSIAPVRGLQHMPSIRMWNINLHQKKCPYKNGVHGKNTNYILVYPNGTYSIRCWSQKLKCCRDGGKINRKPLPDNIRQVMSTYDNFIISPSINN